MVSNLTYIFEEETPRWRKLLSELGLWLSTHNLSDNAPVLDIKPCYSELPCKWSWWVPYVLLTFTLNNSKLHALSDLCQDMITGSGWWGISFWLHALPNDTNKCGFFNAYLISYLSHACSTLTAPHVPIYIAFIYLSYVSPVYI